MVKTTSLSSAAINALTTGDSSILYNNQSRDLVLYSGSLGFSQSGVFNLEINNINGECLKLKYNSSPTNYIDFNITSTGQLNIIPNGADKIVNIYHHNGSTSGLSLGGTLVTASASELNKLDGLTATTAELNYVDTTQGIAEASKALIVDANRDISNIRNLQTENLTVNGTLVTSSATELNYNDITTIGTAEPGKALVADLNRDISNIRNLELTNNLTITNHNGINKGLILGNELVSATASEINILDGVTATTTEINKLAGVTATTSEINKLAGVTATTTELNYVDTTPGTVEASKAVIVDANRDISNIRNLQTENLTVNGTLITASASELNYNDLATIGTAEAGKALVVDINRDISNIRNLTATNLTGSIQTASQTNITSVGTLTGLSSNGNVNIAQHNGSTTGLQLSGTLITANASELNVLDGITSSTEELNILDGVTATANEINVLDGITATTAELNILDGVTATYAEINVLDGITATTAELNILDGVTATANEINVLNGITATTTEINYNDLTTGPGTAEANKALVIDANKDITSIRNLTSTGITTTNLILGSTAITATANEINKLAGVTATGAEINKLAGVTATTAEINYNDLTTGPGTAEASKALVVDANKDITSIRNLTSTGITTINLTLGSTAITATANEINVLDGITATTAELNILDGVTSTTNELNYLDLITGPGSAEASKAIILDSNRDITNIRNLTATNLTGTLQTAIQTNITSVGTLTGLTSSGAISITNTTPSISTSSGALIVSGGVGIGGALNIDGSLIVNNISTIIGTLNLTSTANNTTSYNIYQSWSNPATTAVECDMYINNTDVEFGTSTNHTLKLITNDTARLIITNSGNIGIENTSPSYKLDVSGDINLTGSLRFSGIALTSTITELNYLDLSTGPGTAEASKALVLDSSRNITNINAITTTGALTMSGINRFITMRNSSLTNGQNVSFVLGRSAASNEQGEITFTYSTTVGSSMLSLGHWGGIVLNIFSSGNVSIGNTSNQYKLDINGSLNSTSLYLNGTQITTTASELNILDGITATTTELNYLDLSTGPGTAEASKAIILDSNRDITNIRNLTSTTLTGTLQTAVQTNITSVGTLTGLTSSGAISITNTTASSTSTTGALIVTGGVGISGAVNIGNTLNVTAPISITPTTKTIATYSVDGVIWHSNQDRRFGMRQIDTDSLALCWAAGGTYGDKIVFSESLGTTFNTAVTMTRGILEVAGTRTANNYDFGILGKRYQELEDSSPTGDVVTDIADETYTTSTYNNTTPTITLPSPASTTTNFYRNWWIQILSGIGSGQVRKVLSSNSSRVLTLSGAFTTPLSGSVTVGLYAKEFAGIIWDESANQFTAAHTVTDTLTSNQLTITGYTDFKAKNISINSLALNDTSNYRTLIDCGATAADKIIGLFNDGGSNFYGFGASSSTLRIQTSGGSGGNVSFYTASTSSTLGTERMRIDATKVSILQTTTSTSNTTGALIVSGGVGIGGALNIANNINCSGELTIGSVSSSNRINFSGTTGDASNNHTVLAERIYADTECSELVLFKGNDQVSTLGPDRIRIRSGEIRIQTTYNATNSPEIYTDLLDNNNRLLITNEGKVAFNGFHETTVLPSALNTYTFRPDSNNSSVSLGMISASNKASYILQSDLGHHLFMGTNSGTYNTTLYINSLGSSATSNLGNGICIETNKPANTSWTTLLRATNTTHSISTDLQVNNSAVAFGTFTNNTFSLMTNNSNRLNILNSGNIGIGIDSPSYRLHVVGSSSYTGSYAFYAGSGSGTSTGTSTNNTNTTIYASERIVAREFNAFSDIRIKKNIIDINDSSALNTLRLIEPKQYNYIDTFNNTINPVWGFIAQQVSSVLDYSVNIINDYIPNIYQMANKSLLENNDIKLTVNNPINYDLNGTGKIKLINNNDEIIYVTIKNKLNNTSFLINEVLEDSNYFIYGEEVNNFHSLDKNAIFTITTAAVQELDRTIIEQQNKINILEQKNNELETQIENQNILINEIMQRLSNLDK